MKKVLILFAVSIFTLNVYAQNNVSKVNSREDKFCYQMKNGKMMVVRNDMELTSDYITPKGVTIKPDGTVMRKDGTILMLKEGECVNSEGIIEKKDSYDKEKIDNQIDGD
jgi:hypothetical protein